MEHLRPPLRSNDLEVNKRKSTARSAEIFFYLSLSVFFFAHMSQRLVSVRRQHIERFIYQLRTAAMPAFVGLVIKYVMPLVDELDNLRSNNADLPIDEMLAATLVASWSEQHRQHFDSSMRRRLRRVLRDNACGLMYRDFTPDMLERVMFGDALHAPWEYKDDDDQDQDDEWDKDAGEIAPVVNRDTSKLHRKRNKKRRARVVTTVQQAKENDRDDPQVESRQRRRERQSESLVALEERTDRRKRRKTAR